MKRLKKKVRGTLFRAVTALPRQGLHAKEVERFGATPPIPESDQGTHLFEIDAVKHTQQALIVEHNLHSAQNAAALALVESAVEDSCLLAHSTPTVLLLPPLIATAAVRSGAPAPIPRFSKVH